MNNRIVASKKKTSKTTSETASLKKIHVLVLRLRRMVEYSYVPIAMSGPGSSGNVIAALCSFFIPGLGQLLQGRPFTALIHFCLAGIIWVATFTLGGWIMHVLSALEAAVHRPKA